MIVKGIEREVKLSVYELSQLREGRPEVKTVLAINCVLVGMHSFGVWLEWPQAELLPSLSSIRTRVLLHHL